MRPARYDLRVDRYVPFVQTFDLEGFDLTAPGVNPYFAAQVRIVRDAGQATAGGAAAPPLLDLPLVTNDATGIRIMGVRVQDGIPVTTVRVYITQEDVTKLPLAGERGNDVKLFWDLQFSTDQVLKGFLLVGDVNVLARVTYV